MGESATEEMQRMVKAARRQHLNSLRTECAIPHIYTMSRMRSSRRRRSCTGVARRCMGLCRRGACARTVSR